MKIRNLIFTILLFIFCSQISARCEEHSFNAITYYNQGISHYQTKSYKEAIINFQKAIQTDPNFTDAYYNLGAIYNFLNQKENAISTYAKLLKIQPDDYDAAYEIAKAYYDIASYSLSLKYASNIPESYAGYKKVELLKTQAKNKIQHRAEVQERNKISVADPSKKSVYYKFSSPTGIASDSKGNLYVANYSDNYISKITPEKNHSVFVKSSLINSPVGIAIDKLDNLYLANYETNNILKITQSGSVSVFMTNVKKPYYLYIKNDILYISEQETNTVIKYDLR